MRGSKIFFAESLVVLKTAATRVSPGYVAANAFCPSKKDYSLPSLYPKIGQTVVSVISSDFSASCEA